MPLAVSGGLLVVKDGALATGCCCDPPDEGGYWWCIRGGCYQSELSPEAVTHGRYITQEACQQRCLNSPGLCPCCEEPNVVTGVCEECEEACADIDIDGEACECEDYPYCTDSAECGCCMTCIDQENTGKGRCYPCPDGTICIDADGSGRGCTCTPIEVCLRDPSRCPLPDPPPGWGYECSRNACGDPDCRLSRNGIYRTKLDCYRACVDEPQPNCGIGLAYTTQGALGDVAWTDYHYGIQAAKSTICVAYRETTQYPFRVLIKSPVLDRNCRTIATNVVQRDSGWRRGTAACGCEYDCDKPDKVSQECAEKNPNTPFCCLERCASDPCECTRCCEVPKGCASEAGELKWTKRRGLTSFVVRVLYDTRCGAPELADEICLRVRCNECYEFKPGECEGAVIDGEFGRCCLPNNACAKLTKCQCDEAGGEFSPTDVDDPCLDPDVCCLRFDCGEGGACPTGCCCFGGDPPKCKKTCIPPEHPPCCLPGAGCVPQVETTLCAALGGTSLIGALQCTPGVCCPITFADDCPPDKFCCSSFDPFSPDPPKASCCEKTKCCKEGRCVSCDCDPPCADCEECINGTCFGCAALGKHCCSGVCQDDPCPACCTAQGCVGNLSADGCRAIGGAPVQGPCDPGRCCTLFGVGDCAAGRVCCGQEGGPYTCCPTDCCVDNVCDCGECECHYCIDGGTVPDCSMCPEGYTCGGGDPDLGISPGCEKVFVVENATDPCENQLAVVPFSAWNGPYTATGPCNEEDPDALCFSGDAPP